MAKRNLPLGGAIPMESGERTIRALIQQRSAVDAVDAGGHPTETWSTLMYAWFRKQDQKGEERFVAGQLSGPKVTQWEMGYAASMDPDLLDVPKLRRLVYQSRIYDITDASLIGNREGVELLTLDAKKVTA